MYLIHDQEKQNVVFNTWQCKYILQ